MNTNSTKLPRLRGLLTTGVAAAALLLLPAQQVLAFPFFLNTFNGLYGTAGTPLDNCGVCHTNFQTSTASSPGPLNAYGDAFKAQGDLQAIEDADSDGDTTTNIAEITQGFFPGWNCSNYGDATGTTPANFIDLVDPANVGCVVNSAPIADAGGPYVADVGEAMIFDGSGSIDPDNDPLTYIWDFGDGSSLFSSEDPTATYIYAMEGDYEVKLTVDDGSLSSSDTTLASITLPIVDVCDFSVDTMALDFGIVEIGDAPTQVRTVTNLGAATCVIMAEVGSLSGQFTLASSPSLSIVPGGSADVEVEFAPLVKGTDRGSIRLVSDDPNNPQAEEILLSGVGITPAPPESCSFVVTDPDTPLDFGDVETGASATLAKTVTNNGSVTCDIEATVASATGQFTLASNPTLSIAPGDSTDVSVTFAPAAEGMDAGNLNLLSNDPNQPLSVDIALSGNGIAPPVEACDFTVDPASLAFGSLTIGNTSTLSTTVTNNGGAECSLNASVSGSSEFTLDSASPVSVAAGGTASVSVIYTPIDVGDDLGDLNLTDAGTGQSVDVGLSGSGVDVPPVEPPPVEPPVTACEGIKVKAKWKNAYRPHKHSHKHHHKHGKGGSKHGQLFVFGRGERDGKFILSNAYDPEQIIAKRSGRTGRFFARINGKRLSPVPCRVQVDQPGLGLCGQADVINAPKDCGPIAPK